MTAVAPSHGRPARVWKGHGTGNDFVIVRDLDAELDLTPGWVRALCDRRTGIGGDGVLRVVRTELVPDAPASAAGTTYFMDYRNADGSIAQMCGNGLRVFVRFLTETGLAAGPQLLIGTRAGALTAALEPDGLITVDLGVPRPLPDRPQVAADPQPTAVSGRAVLMPNPHVVIEVADAQALAALQLDRPPAVIGALPEGQNIEFVVTAGDHHLQMRVHERGVGETRSCGTGIGAVVAVRARIGDPQSWRVDVPGGTCRIRWAEDGHMWLTGPAVIVAEIELDPAWSAAAVTASPVAITV